MVSYPDDQYQIGVWRECVLILVVMEEVSYLFVISILLKWQISLNPYCSGRWSRTIVLQMCSIQKVQVLILIVVEDGLVPDYKFTKLDYMCVLILIVVEDGLVPRRQLFVRICVQCLNPYCSGQWARTLLKELMPIRQMSLNPYCSGRWSRTPVAH